ncbi:hypothetical protein ES703_106978 [subsurface metagenome]
MQSLPMLSINHYIQSKEVGRSSDHKKGFLMPPKGYVTITVPRALAVRLRKMKDGLGLDSPAACIEYLLRLTMW